ncbi:MAG TPA: IclR family transcriptional regulator [Baekduia sp.]
MAAGEAWHVGRTMRVLELLAFTPLSAPQIASAMQAHPRTVRRVLERLVEEDYLTRTDDARRLYSPTMRLVALAGQVIGNSELARRGRPYVALAQERTGAVAHLVVPSYQEVVCVVHCAGDAPDEPPRVRELVPAHCTAGGKALLAWRAPWRDSVLSAALERFTDRTITDPARLREQLAAVREAGHAVEDGEYQVGVRAVAAPVLVGDAAVAALSISGRGLDVARAAEQVQASAADLGRDLAHGG